MTENRQKCDLACQKLVSSASINRTTTLLEEWSVGRESTGSVLSSYVASERRLFGKMFEASLKLVFTTRTAVKSEELSSPFAVLSREVSRETEPQSSESAPARTNS